MKIKLIMMIVLLLSLRVAATPPSNLEVKLRYEVSSSNFNPMNPMAGIDETGDAKVSLIIALADEDIESIEVTLKRSSMGEILISKSFNYGVSGTLADGTRYNSKENVVELSLGTFNDLSTYYAEVKVTNTNGNVSTPLIKEKK